MGEDTSHEEPMVSPHVHERIELGTIIEAVGKSPSPRPFPTRRRGRGEGLRLLLFEREGKESLPEVIEFYEDKQGWANLPNRGCLAIEKRRVAL